MTTKPGYVRTALALVGLLVSSSLGAQAINTTCQNATLVVPNGSQHEDTLTATPDFRWFRFVAKANRSYSVVAESLSPPDVNRQIGMSTIRVPPCPGTSLAGQRSTQSVEPVSQEGIGGAAVGAIRRSFQVSTDTTLFFGVHNNIGTGAGLGSFRVRVEETTLFSPLWSTFSVFETFYRFQNSTNASCNVTLRMVNDGGAQVANDTSIISPNSTAPTRNTGPTDLNLADNQAGQTVITHDCPPGAIQVDGFLRGVNPDGGLVVLPVKFQAARQQR